MRNPREERKRKQLGNSLTGNTPSAQSYASNNYSQMSNSYNAQANAIKAPTTQRPTGIGQNKYQSQYEEAYNAIKNRDPFKYNQKEDPLYQQYADMYARNAKLAMQDTMGQAAALTGGYGNSYAATAGQAMYNQAMAGLNEKALDLYNTALDTYNAEGDRLAQMYSMAADMYGMENDNLRYAAELAENQYQYDNNYAQQMREYYSDLGYKYGAMGEDARQYDQNFAENRRQFDLNYNEDKRRYDQDFLEKQRQFNEGLDWDKYTYQTDFTENARRFDEQMNLDRDNLAYNYMIQGYTPTGARTQAWKDEQEREDKWRQAELDYNYAINGYTKKAEENGYEPTVQYNYRNVYDTLKQYGKEGSADTLMTEYMYYSKHPNGNYQEYLYRMLDKNIKD